MEKSVYYLFHKKAKDLKSEDGAHGTLLFCIQAQVWRYKAQSRTKKSTSVGILVLIQSQC